MSDLAPLLAIVFSLSIPLVAIVGGITAGIVKSNARRRLVELAQRERIAAIERGIDPDKLPALHVNLGEDPSAPRMTFEQRQLRRSQALIIWGMALTGFGVALVFGIGLNEHDLTEGAPALMFVGVGLALLIGGFMVRPDREDLKRSIAQRDQMPTS